tara:strand:+ start:409 stop:798 length:390 start_codon:yes stop_codon:yes gene_type:complete
MKNLNQKILKAIKSTRDSGQQEYAHDDDNVFANFERVASVLNITREKSLMVYLLKHIDGIAAYVNGHESQREDVRGRLTDVIVYSMLLWGMIEEGEQKHPDIDEEVSAEVQWRRSKDVPGLMEYGERER